MIRTLESAYSAHLKLGLWKSSANKEPKCGAHCERFRRTTPNNCNTHTTRRGIDLQWRLRHLAIDCGRIPPATAQCECVALRSRWIATFTRQVSATAESDSTCLGGRHVSDSRRLPFDERGPPAPIPQRGQVPQHLRMSPERRARQAVSLTPRQVRHGAQGGACEKRLHGKSAGCASTTMYRIPLRTCLRASGATNMPMDMVSAMLFAKDED